MGLNSKYSIALFVLCIIIGVSSVDRIQSQNVEQNVIRFVLMTGLLRH
jgi:hypothetical protein